MFGHDAHQAYLEAPYDAAAREDERYERAYESASEDLDGIEEYVQGDDEYCQSEKLNPLIEAVVNGKSDAEIAAAAKNMFASSITKAIEYLTEKSM